MMTTPTPKRAIHKVVGGRVTKRGPTPRKNTAVVKYVETDSEDGGDQHVSVFYEFKISHAENQTSNKLPYSFKAQMKWKEEASV